MERETVEKGYLGIELGSTRIKAVLSSKDDFSPLAYGEYSWENRLENGIWTYHLDDAITGIRECYADLVKNISEKYGFVPTKYASIGISGMMHGYLVFDKDWKQLAPFRTWRNTMTERASKILSEKFSYNIPQRWSIAHLYESILDGEEHVSRIAHLTTLSSYIHFLLTGENVIGKCEASGMLALGEDGDLDGKMIAIFDDMIKDKKFPWKMRDIFPRVIDAGCPAGTLTKEGARLLDPSGNLSCGITLCSPEGDAATGMTATNSVASHTGNISAGTSIFAMAVLDAKPSGYCPEIDVITTPSGKYVAMVHGNNCTGDIDAWIKLFGSFSELFGMNISKADMYYKLYNLALTGDADCGGLVAYNFVSGEHIVGVQNGCPAFFRPEGSCFSLANFIRSLLFSTLACMRLGFDILSERGELSINEINGHGGMFKTQLAAQKIVAAALKTPVTVSKTAGEGGPWGMSLLAAYLDFSKTMTLEDFLKNRVFGTCESTRVEPDLQDVSGFEKFLSAYKAGLCAEKTASTAF